MTNSEQITSALSFIPSDDRDTWLKTGMAIKSELGDEGFPLWDYWSRSADSYNASDAQSVWKSFAPGGGVSIGTLFHEAKERGWSWAGDSLTQAEIDQKKKNQEARNRLSRKQRAKEQKDAAEVGLKLWKAGSNEPSKYSQGKGTVQVETVRTLYVDVVAKIIGYRPKTSNKKHADNPYLEGQITLVPVVGDGKISTIEMIDEAGRKSALKNGAKSGCFWAAQKRPQGDGSGLTLLIGEGTTTVLSGKQATGHFAFAALSCHNLPSTAKQIREAYLKAKIIILSDLGNGQKSATEAAQAVDGLLALPEFPEGTTGSDFNDLYLIAGPEEVKRQIEAATTPPEVEQLKSPLQEEDKTLIHWDEPLLYGEINTPKIPATILPSWMGEYAEAVAKTTQTPEGMAVMLSLSVVATCIQKKFIVSPTDAGYYEPVNIWTVTGLPSASRKTAVIDAQTEPLNIWEREQAEQMIDEIRQTKIKRDVNLARIQRLTKQAAGEDDPQQRQVLLHDIAEVEKDTPEEIRPPRLWTGDATPERLQGMLVEYGEKMSLLSDEAGIFEVMAGLYTDGRVNIDVFLQSHAGKSVRVDRTSRTAHLDAPALSFGLAIQPAIIADLSQGSKKKFRGNGALARFLYCLPQNNIGKRDVRKREAIHESVKSKYHAGINSLLNIEPVLNQDDKEIPRRLVLNAEALECWLAFSEFIERKQGTNGEYEPIQDWTGKLPGAALRIAANFHVVEHGLSLLTINRSTMENALDLAELLIEHAKAAFDLMGADQVTDDAKAILQWITSSNMNQFTKNEVRKALKGRWTKAERLNRALEDLRSRDIVGDEFKEETNGRYARVYPVNPYIQKGLAA